MNKWLYISCLLLYSCHSTPYVQGKRLYTAYCANCHMEDGSGLSAMIPDIRKSKIVNTPEFVCLLYHGKTDTVFSENSFLVREMPSFKNLSATEVTNIINYIHHTWHTDFTEKTILKTNQDLENCRN
jgi:mono/diheme cytochrome c family protein